MRVALVHHWMVSARGGERVLAELSRLFPGATLFTLVHDPVACPAPPGVARVVTSPLQHLPAASRSFRALLPLLPRAYAALDLSGHDLVLSSDAALAKTVRIPSGVPHVCLCYSPPRWAWDLSEVYLRRAVPAPLRPLARALLAGTRRADREAAGRVTRFLAISQHVRARIARCYDRDSQVVYPPIDTDFFSISRVSGGADPAERPYLALGEAVPYKRFDLALAACRALDRPLVVAGGGRRLAALRALAGPRTRFVPDPDDAQVRELYRGCRALLFPGEEDFGLVPLEAMACGRPVIALARGGATETVIDGVTGCLYPEGSGAGASSDSGLALDGASSGPGEVGPLIAALRRFESLEDGLDPRAARARAEEFSTARFDASLLGALGDLAAVAAATGTPLGATPLDPR
jgi:glycosyltransferase involved in cell wall biosynthesis